MPASYSQTGHAHSQLQDRSTAMQAQVSNPGRTLQCAYCQTEVLICTRCDHGQRYCSQDCRQQARAACVRKASRRYQSSRAGRLNHARRQQRCRDRQRERQRQHPSSPSPANSDSSPSCQKARGDDVLPPRLNVKPAPAHKPTPTWHCHWCAQALTSVARCSWLLHATSEPIGQR